MNRQPKLMSQELLKDALAFPTYPAGDEPDRDEAQNRVLLEDLDEFQYQAVTTASIPLRILAGAGSGKTRVLTRKIAWRIRQNTAKPSHVLAITFTRKAAGELRTRLKDLDISQKTTIGTFHSVALAQLKIFWSDHNISHPRVMASKSKLLSELVASQQAHFTREQTEQAGIAMKTSELSGEIEWAKARMLTPESYYAAALREGRSPTIGVSKVVELYDSYELAKKKRNLVDMEDILDQCAEMIEHNSLFAAGQRWRFRHFFVDEFQDVNPAQFRLLRAWVGDRKDLCVVGDPNQAIYSWNGADPSLLDNLGRCWSSMETVTLPKNYRSTPQIVTVANRVKIRADMVVSGGVVSGGVGEGKPKTVRDGGPIPTLTSYVNDVKEATGIARLLRCAWASGYPWSAMAVLFRTNAQLLLVQQTLKEAGIACNCGNSATFIRKPEVLDILRECKKLNSGSEFTTWLDDVSFDASCTDVSDTLSDTLQSVVFLAREYIATEETPTGNGFYDWVMTAASLEAVSQDKNAVELVTFHRAKGLEWPVVFLAGLEDGFLPMSHARTASAVDEERRLLYVAVTRAEEELHCSWAQYRTINKRTISRQPSPWLSEIADAIDAMEGDRQGGQSQSNLSKFIADARASLNASRTDSFNSRPSVVLERLANEEVLKLLREWRAGMARVACVPPHVIMHDSTLAELACELPTNNEKLMGIKGIGPIKAMSFGEQVLEIIKKGIS